MKRKILVENLDMEALTPFFMSELQLKRIYEPAQGLFVCESVKVISRALAAGYEAVCYLISLGETSQEFLDFIETIDDVPVYAAPEEMLSKIIGYNLTGGILCVMKRRILPSLNEVCKNAKRIVVCEDVVNPANLGTIFRSAAALSMDAVVLTPGCTDPLYRRAARVSMGNVFQIPWTYIDNYGHSNLEPIKELGFKTAAMCLNDKSVDIDDAMLNAEEKLAIVLGTEGDGLKNVTIENADYSVKIPMSHGVDSLNVAAAGAIAFWQLGRHK